MRFSTEKRLQRSPKSYFKVELLLGIATRKQQQERDEKVSFHLEGANNRLEPGVSQAVAQGWADELTRLRKQASPTVAGGCNEASASAEGSPLGSANPRGRGWRPLRRGLAIQQRGDNIAKVNTQVLGGSGRTTIFGVRGKHERTKAIPGGTELGNNDSRQIVGEFIALIGA